MIDVKQFVDRFSSLAIDIQLVNRGRADDLTIDELDQRAIAAINDPDATDRRAVIRKWLSDYSVLRTYDENARNKIADSVLGFADKRVDSDAPQDATDPRLLAEFERLESSIRDAVKGAGVATNKNGKPREVVSLCSKALWLCYPETVPIYDGYALTSVRVLRRLLQLPAPDAGREKYAAYVISWSDIYDLCLPHILTSRLRDYPYKARAFDKMLWILGQPNFKN